ncbi:MAG: hypothetical protein ACR2LK_05965 [Solirubrobacteraceae bacterium]
MTGEPSDAEVVDAVAVLDEPRAIASRRSRGALAPMVAQTAAVAGASMVAGATAVALARRGRTRRLKRRRSQALPPVLASRSFLINVHVLGERK